MNLCKDCRSNEECCLDKRPKSDCFFYSETEEHRIRNSKEYQQGRADAIEYVVSGQYAKDNHKCPMCMDCPKNCPLDGKGE